MCEATSVLLHVRCGGCSKLYRSDVTLPPGRPAPADGDELLYHPEIREMAFKCPKCEAEGAEIVAFKVCGIDEAA